MKKLTCSYSLSRILLIKVTAFVFLVFSLTHLAHAIDKPSHTATDTVEKNEQIHIIADELVSDNETNSFEFIGNVKATQGDSVITGDRLKVFYKKNLDNKKNPLAGEQSIQKIIVTGNVVIRFDNRVAKTEQAIYTTENRILVLSGPGSKIIRGKDSISGEKITLYRTDERIKVESGNENRVEALFYSKEKGLN